MLNLLIVLNKDMTSKTNLYFNAQIGLAAPHLPQF